MARTGRKPTVPTPNQVAQAQELAKTGMSDTMISEAVGIAHATFSYNKGKKHFQDFLAAIRRGRATGVALVAGANFKAAVSDKDPTRDQARARHLKHVDRWADRLEVTGADGAPLGDRATPALKPADVRRALEIYSRSTRNADGTKKAKR